MKKTININLGGRIFHIEDDAYASLDAYLNEVKTKFGFYPDSEEIIADIEDRIAEHFEGRGGGKQDTIISIIDVMRLIGIMGHAEDFDSTGTETDSTKTKSTPQIKSSARLYRNTDDAVLGGVASGIAAYFDWDPLWIRLAFVASIFLGGWTILLYIILWIIVPEAESNSEKLEMKGDPITLESIEKNIKEKNNDNQKMRGSSRKAGALIEQLFSSLGNILIKLAWVAVKVIGFLLLVGGIIGMFAVTFGLIAAIVTGNSPDYIQFPLKEFLGTPAYYVTLFAAYMSALIPLLLASFVGSWLMGTSKVLITRINVGLAVVWLFAIGAVGIISIQNAPRLEPFIDSHPMFQEIDKEYPVGEFTSIEVSNAIAINIVEGPTSVKASAVQMDLDRLVVENRNGTLVIDIPDKNARTNDGKWCLFCLHQIPEFTISTSNLQSLIATDAVNVNLTKETNSPLAIAVRDASRLTGKFKLDKLQLELKDASRATLEGTVKELVVIATDASSVNAENLTVETADAKASDASRLSLYVTKTLKADATDASRIEFTGGAQMTGNLRDPEETRNHRENIEREYRYDDINRHNEPPKAPQTQLN